MSGNCPGSPFVLMDASTEALGCRFFYTTVDLCWARRTSTRLFSFNFLSLGLFIQFGNEHRGLKTYPKRGQGERRERGGDLSLHVGACQSREPKIRHAGEQCFFTHLSSESDGSGANSLFILACVSDSHDMVAAPVNEGEMVFVAWQEQKINFLITLFWQRSRRSLDFLGKLHLIILARQMYRFLSPFYLFYVSIW